MDGSGCRQGTDTLAETTMILFNNAGGRMKVRSRAAGMRLYAGILIYAK